MFFELARLRAEHALPQQLDMKALGLISPQNGVATHGLPEYSQLDSFSIDDQKTHEWLQWRT